MNSFFVDALVHAGLCKDHALRAGPTHSPRRTILSSYGRKCQSSYNIHARRHYHSSRQYRQPAQAQLSGVSKEDFLGLVDYYQDDASVALPAPDPGVESPKNSTQAGWEMWQSDRYEELQGQAHQQMISRLEEALAPEDGSHDTIYRLYKELPSPGVSCLPQSLVRLLLQRLSVVEQKNESSMLRYLTVVDDMKAAKIPLTMGQWNSAISFTGRCFSRVSRVEVESALYVWKEMENEAGMLGNHVTFNILFDIAVKAGKFVLADMVLKEMQARGLDLMRHGRVGLIYYYGCKGDGNGVRRAYRQLVSEGEIVDTTVLNCVIAALHRAEEGEAADLVYERMRALQATRVGATLPPREWRARRDLGKHLQREAAKARQRATKPEDAQLSASVAPDVQTFRILIRDHTGRTGNLDRVVQLLEDMRSYGFSVDAPIYRLLLQGFANHGGVRYTSWTRSRLEDVWSAVRDAVQAEPPQAYMGKYMIIWSVRAFGKCTTKARTREVWEEIETRWRPPEEEAHVVNGVLAEVLAA